MGRFSRYQQASFALWPDPGLLDAAATLTGLPVILRTELNHHGMVNLTVDFSDNHSFSPGDPGAALNEGSHHRLLRLEWQDRWEGQRFFSNRVYALESYDEFYAGPFGTFHPTHQGVPQSYFYEIVNDPDPWIAEILEENNNTDIFPPSGQPMLMSERARKQNPHLQETGRFFPPDSPQEASGQHAVYIGTPTPEQLQAAQAEQRAHREEQRLKPRYRHLLIASETHFLEVLCDDLPQWRWMEG